MLDEVPKLDDLLTCPSYIEMEELFNGGGDDSGESDAANETETAKTPVKGGKAAPANEWGEDGGKADGDGDGDTDAVQQTTRKSKRVAAPEDAPPAAERSGKKKPATEDDGWN
jgi:hypothetical protein